MSDVRSFGLFFLSLLLLLSFPAFAAGDPLVGLWQTKDKDAVIEFYECEEKFCGRFYWLKDDPEDNPSRDDKNRDPALRSRPLCGLTFLGGFKKTGEGFYGNGWLYSPRHGANFSAQLSLKNKDELELRGYAFLPLLGDTQTWRRLENAPACPALQKK